MKLEYIKAGDYYIPALRANEEPEGMLSKYGLMRQNFLREHRSGIYTGMLLEGKLKKHCLMIQEQADERMDVLVSQMAQSDGVDDLRLESPSVDFQSSQCDVLSRLKAENQLSWVRKMNNIRARAEEVVVKEIILQ